MNLMRATAVFTSTVILGLSLSIDSAAAQPKVTREAEVNGSLFFGNTSQRLASLRAGISRADSAFEVSLGGGFTYADVEDAAGVRAVNRRSWTAGTSLDWRPFATVSPFLFGNVESSLEKQIDMRWGAGVGAKWVIHRDTVHLHDFSVAVLGEKTTPRVETPGFNDDLLARWSARYRVKGKLSSGVSYSSTTLYKPAVSDMDDYSISSVNSLGVALNTTLSLTLTFIDNYDSQARVRGAAENNDGQLLIGLKASW
jgi:hypothetical protein